MNLCLLVWKGSKLVCKNESKVCKNRSRSEMKRKNMDSDLSASLVLGKVKDFLSEAKRRGATESKEEREGSKNMELLTGSESEYIEMDLLLGIADLHTVEAVAAAERAVDGYRPFVQGETDSEESDTESKRPKSHILEL